MASRRANRARLCPSECFEMWVGLRQHALDALSQVRCSIIERSDDAVQRVGRRSRLRHIWESRLLKSAKAVLDPVTSLRRIIVEHLDCIERILVEIVVNQVKFLDDIVGDGDDVTTDGISLKNVKKLARTCPDDFCFWVC